MAYQKPRGTQDILPGESERWQAVEAKARDLCRRYNYREIRTPIFEHTELFLRSVGETTDVVEKEMYTFLDKAERSLSLRPEGTAGVVRAYLENKLYGQPEVSKLFYIGPMFRYENPQAGRYRQLHQFGVEAFGAEDPAIDAEIIALGYSFYTELGLKEVGVDINSVGTPESRERYRGILQQALDPIKPRLCNDCLSRYDKNPLRILDCKTDQKLLQEIEIPSILDYLDEASERHFAEVQSYLQAFGIPFRVDPSMVRGLDYYTHTAFEFKAAGIGAIDTIGGGGRYNGLVQQIGNQDQPGVGFGIGLERTLLILEHQQVELPIAPGVDVFMAVMGEAAKEAAMRLVYELRKAGLKAETDYLGRKMKGQFKAADRAQARYTAILGEDELSRGVISLKRMDTGDQTEVPMNELVQRLQ